MCVRLPEWPAWTPAWPCGSGVMMPSPSPTSPPARPPNRQTASPPTWRQDDPTPRHDVHTQNNGAWHGTVVTLTGGYKYMYLTLTCLVQLNYAQRRTVLINRPTQHARQTHGWHLRRGKARPALHTAIHILLSAPTTWEVMAIICHLIRSTSTRSLLGVTTLRNGQGHIY